MLDWHSCQIYYPLEIKILLLLEREMERERDRELPKQGKQKSNAVSDMHQRRTRASNVTE